MTRKKVVWILLTLVLLALAVLGVGKATQYFYRKAYPLGYEQLVNEACAEQNLEPSFVFAVIRTESGFRPLVQSSVGARGLMQITEETFQWIQYRMNDTSGITYEDLFDEATNIRYGTFLLRLLLQEFDTPSNALCAYHAGWGNVKKWLSDPDYAPDGENIVNIPFGDTKKYVQKVLDTQKTYQKLYGI